MLCVHHSPAPPSKRLSAAKNRRSLISKTKHLLDTIGRFLRKLRLGIKRFWLPILGNRSPKRNCGVETGKHRLIFRRSRSGGRKKRSVKGRTETDAGSFRLEIRKGRIYFQKPWSDRRRFRLKVQKNRLLVPGNRSAVSRTPLLVNTQRYKPYKARPPPAG